MTRRQKRRQAELAKDETTRTEIARKRRVFAICPRNPAHPGAMVYRTEGRARRCKCNTCGETWVQYGPRAGADDE